MSDAPTLKRCPLWRTICKPNCAWWDDLSQSCAVVLLAKRFDAITSTDDRLMVDYEISDDVSCSHT